MQKFLRLHREFHRKTGEDFPGVPVDNQAHGLFGADAPLVAVEQLVLADLRGRGFVLDDRRRVVGTDDREGMGPALGADEEAVALRVIPGILRPGIHPHQAAVTVLAAAGGNALRDDPALGVPADMDHLRACVGLLIVVRNRDGVELGSRVIALQDG